MADVVFHEHPDYCARRPMWEKHRALYDGDAATLKAEQYLWYHDLEFSQSPVPGSSSRGRRVAGRQLSSGGKETIGEKIRRIRQQRSTYLNLFEPIVSTLVSMAFRTAPEPDKKVIALFEDAIDDVDGHGTSLVNFIKNQVAVAYFRDGKPIVLVDAPKDPGRTKAQQKQAGWRPFIEVVDVLAAKDWQLITTGPDAGKFRWLRWEYEEVAAREEPTEAPANVTYSKVYKQTGQGTVIATYQLGEGGKWDLVDESPLGGWKELPITSLVGNDPWVKDAAEVCLQTYNLMSARFNQLNAQAFQRVIIAGNNQSKQMVSISEYGWATVAEGSTVTVVQPTDTVALNTTIGEMIEATYTVVFNRLRTLPADSKEAPGAETIREMKEEFYSLLSVAVDEIEQITRSFIRHYAMFKLGTDKGAKFDGEVVFAKDFTVEDFAQQSELFAVFRSYIDEIDPWLKANLEKVARKQNLPKEKMPEIIKGIEGYEKKPPVFSPFPTALMNGKRAEGSEGDRRGQPGPDEEGNGKLRPPAGEVSRQGG